MLEARKKGWNLCAAYVNDKTTGPLSLDREGIWKASLNELDHISMNSGLILTELSPDTYCNTVERSARYKATGDRTTLRVDPSCGTIGETT